jgi:hypothetical protein
MNIGRFGNSKGYNARVTHAWWKRLHECCEMRFKHLPFPMHVTTLCQHGLKDILSAADPARQMALFAGASDAISSRSKSLPVTLEKAEIKHIQDICGIVGYKFEDVIATCVALGYNKHCIEKAVA